MAYFPMENDPLKMKMPYFPLENAINKFRIPELYLETSKYKQGLSLLVEFSIFTASGVVQEIGEED
jgi:hypothetical protein